jgi:phage FluMu gp28-like protein
VEQDQVAQLTEGLGEQREEMVPIYYLELEALLVEETELVVVNMLVVVVAEVKLQLQVLVVLGVTVLAVAVAELEQVAELALLEVMEVLVAETEVRLAVHRVPVVEQEQVLVVEFLMMAASLL